LENNLHKKNKINCLPTTKRHPGYERWSHFLSAYGQSSPSSDQIILRGFSLSLCGCSMHMLQFCRPHLFLYGKPYNFTVLTLGLADFEKYLFHTNKTGQDFNFKKQYLKTQGFWKRERAFELLTLIAQTSIIIINVTCTVLFKSLGLVRFFNIFKCLFCSPRLHLFVPKYSKNSNTVRYLQERLTSLSFHTDYIN